MDQLGISGGLQRQIHGRKRGRRSSRRDKSKSTRHRQHLRDALDALATTFSCLRLLPPLHSVLPDVNKRFGSVIANALPPASLSSNRRSAAWYPMRATPTTQFTRTIFHIDDHARKDRIHHHRTRRRAAWTKRGVNTTGGSFRQWRRPHYHHLAWKDGRWRHIRYGWRATTPTLTAVVTFAAAARICAHHPAYSPPNTLRHAPRLLPP